jgi:hypothetical protein
MPVPYDYQDLLPFVGETAPGPQRTAFRKVELARIQEAEARLGFPFPRQVRAFYETIGSGTLCVSRRPPRDARWSTVVNRILHPQTVAALYLNEAADSPDPPLRRNELPVFEGLPGQYLIVDPFSGTPNAVHSRHKISEVAAGFADFIQRLRDEDAVFYLR